MRVGITGMSNHEGCILQVEAKCGVEGWLILFEAFKIFRENLYCFESFM
jgi:hypothetical protein